jgi:hypothetical protein
MNTNIDRLLAHYRPKGVLVDSNLLLLFLVGLADRRLIRDFKRTCVYSEEDHDLLCRVFAWFRLRIVTSHVLTEVSNLIGQLPNERQALVRLGLCESFEQLVEESVPTGTILRRSEFLKFGLTDTALFLLAKRKMLLLTVDLPLASLCESSRLDVLNFNHLRQAQWMAS